MNIFKKEEPYLGYFNDDDGIWYICEECGFREHLQPYSPSVKSAIIARDNHAMTDCDAPEEKMTYTNEWNLDTPLIGLSEEDCRRVEYRIEHVLMHTEIDELVTIKSSDKLLAEIMKALLPSWEPKEER